MKPLIAVYIVGSGYFAMALRLSLLGHTPFDETLCPKYSIFSLKIHPSKAWASVCVA